MKTFIPFAIFILFLIAVQFASGKTVDDIIEAYEAARGGKEKLAAIKTIYMEGNRKTGGNEIAVKITKEQGKLSRTAFETGEKNAVKLLTEKEGWNYYSAQMQQPEKITGQGVELWKTDLDIAGPLVDYPAKEHKVELLGKEMVGSNNCYKLKLIPTSGAAITYWIDTGSYLLLQSSVTADRIIATGGGNSQQPTEITLYKDYKWVDGVLFPHTIETFNSAGENGNGSSITFGKIEINQPVDGKLYHPE